MFSDASESVGSDAVVEVLSVADASLVADCSGFFCTAVGFTVGSGSEAGVVFGWAGTVFASLFVRVPTSLASESTWRASGSAASDADNVDMAVIVVTGGVGMITTSPSHSWIFHPRQPSNLDFRAASRDTI